MMKKRLLALLMAAVMTISLLPTTAWAHDAAHAEGIRDTEGVEDVQGSEGDRDLEEVSDSENVPGEDAVDAAALAAVEDDGPAALAAATTLDSYFEGLPVIAETEPGSPSSTKKWKVTTLGGDTVLMSGNKGKSSSTSTLQLTFTGDTHLTFEYKVSSEKNYDKCTITLGSDKLVNGESGDQNWKPLELDAKSGQVLTVVYKKDSGVDRFDDCVYLRNFSAGEALVVTFHANNGTEDTAQQKVYGGKAALKANTFTCENKIFAGWAAAADGEVLYQDGERITTETSLDLYAVWADAYTVTFDNDGATATVMTPRNGAIGSRIPADPSRKGYTFDGWFNGETKLTAETVISGDSTYTAKWTAITYTIAFSGGSESTGSVESIPAAYDREVTLPRNAFTRPGYSFNGWSQSSSASKGSYAEGDAVKNLTSTQGTTVTLYAAWQPLPVTVRLHLNYAGAEDITRTGAVGSNYNYILTDAGTTRFNSITDPKRDGYIFDGWYDAAEGGSAISTTYKFTAADAEDGFDMYAHWVKGIIVHFDGNGYKGTLADKTVTPDKVYSSLTYLLRENSYPANKTLEGWYIKNADGSFGEAVAKDTVFSGDEVTLIAKWRDYQYIIKYHVKSGDKSGVTGTMADQPAPFGQDVKLAKCAYVREGYDFAGWATSSYGSTIAHPDEAVINRAWEEDDWGDGSEDNESYTLYAVWTERKSPEQTAADEKLNAADTAVTGNYKAVYGTDTNALTMIGAKLNAAGIKDVTVTMKAAASGNYAGIDADGTIRYKWNTNGSTPAADAFLRPTVVLSYQGADGKTYTKETDGCYFIIGLDEAKARAALQTVADRITLPAEISSADALTSLPRYPLKAGVDAGSVDYNDNASVELWTTAAWTSSNTGVIAITQVSYPYYAPYTAAVTLPQKDTAVTLTLTLTYNGREDLKVSKVYTVNVKGSAAVRELDYQELLETALTEYGLKDPRDSSAIDNANVVSDIQFPTTWQLNTIAYRDYEKEFDGKYTPVLLTTSDDSVVVSADPATANVARMVTYRPLPGQAARTVTVTMKILSRPGGEGKDYASMTVLASRDITLTVQPLTQAELDAAAAFMQKVCTEEVYWEGIRKANTDRNGVTGDMRSFIEIVPNGDGYKFVRDMADYNAVGVKADDIDGWYDAQQYRCFRSSNSAVVAHETLLLTQPQYNTRITIDSVLSYTEYAKYWEKFRSDPAYAQFARFYKQPISVSVKVIGTEGIDDPNIQPITVTVNVEGGGFRRTFADLTGGTYTCSSSDGRTAADALLSVLAQNRYTYTGTPGYITGVTDANGVALTAGDKTFGPWSGWMFTVNGEMPILRTDASGNITYAALNQYQVKKDDVIRFYYVACPTETGYHTGGTATCTSGAVCTVCGAAYGEKNPDNHTGEQTWTRTADKHRMRYDCCSAEVIPSQPHSWENGACSVCGYACRHSGGEATCTTPLTCARCGEVYGAKDPANHSGKLVWVTTADKHVRQYDCCGLAVTAEAAHSWENGACGVCGYACRHVGGETVKENVKPATCTADGSHDDVVYCTVCKAEMSRSTVTDKAAGHQWDKGVVTTVPTSEKEGVRTYTCTVCRAVRTEAIDKLPGSGDGKTDQAAADAVIEKINGIGTVTRNSKSAIEAARRAYDALSEDQKALIPAGAVKTLTDAEAAYAKMTRHNHSGNASGGTKDDTGKVESSRTGDAGVAMYAAMSLLSAMGGAWVVGRKRKKR